MVAGRVGEQLARLHEENLSRARAQSEQVGRDYAARLQAERAVACTELAPVHHDQWWASADADVIGGAYRTATVWQDREPEALRAVSRIRAEMRDRYGIDVDAAGGDPAVVQTALARAAALQLEAEAQRRTARENAITGALLVAEADRIDRRADADRLAEPESGADARDADAFTVPGGVDPRAGGEQEERSRADALRDDGGLAYDSAERRETMASGLEGKADAETIRARVVADTSQARPPREAVKSDPSPAAATRRRGRSVQRQRSGLGR